MSKSHDFRSARRESIGRKKEIDLAVFLANIDARLHERRIQWLLWQSVSGTPRVYNLRMTPPINLLAANPGPGPEDQAMVDDFHHYAAITLRFEQPKQSRAPKYKGYK